MFFSSARFFDRLLSVYQLMIIRHPIINIASIGLLSALNKAHRVSMK
jgi:hypothetical protein